MPPGACEARKRKGRLAFGFPGFPFLHGCVEEERKETLFVVSLTRVSTLQPSLRFDYHSLLGVAGVSTLGPVQLFFFFFFAFFLSFFFFFIFALGLNGWIVENCIGLQVVEQLMGPSQGPAITKGNLFFALFLTVVSQLGRRRRHPLGGQLRGVQGSRTLTLPLTHSPSHTRPHAHTHLIVIWSGKGASWLVGAGVWHGFEVLPATGRYGDRGWWSAQENPRTGSRTRRMTGTNPTPNIFPPLSP